MTLQQRKARAFKEALEKFDRYKDELNRQVANGNLTREQANKKLEVMAEKLDL